MNSVWSSAGAGAILGLFYTGAGVLVVKIARHTPKFVPVVFGGMVLRMLLALTILGILIQLFSVVLPALTGAFLIVVQVGIFSEIFWLAKKRN